MWLGEISRVVRHTCLGVILRNSADLASSEKSNQPGGSSRSARLVVGRRPLCLARQDISCGVWRANGTGDQGQRVWTQEWNASVGKPREAGGQRWNSSLPPNLEYRPRLAGGTEAPKIGLMQRSCHVIISSLSLSGEFDRAVSSIWDHVTSEFGVGKPRITLPCAIFPFNAIDSNSYPCSNNHLEPRSNYK